MGIIQRIKDYFTQPCPKVELPPQVEEEVPSTEEQQEQPAVLSEKHGERIAECEYCKNPIEEWQKRRTFNGKKFHRKCFKIGFKEARKWAFK